MPFDNTLHNKYLGISQAWGPIGKQCAMSKLDAANVVTAKLLLDKASQSELSNTVVLCDVFTAAFDALSASEVTDFTTNTGFDIAVGNTLVLDLRSYAAALAV